MIDKYKLLVKGIIDRKFSEGNYINDIPCLSPDKFILPSHNSSNIVIVTIGRSVSEDIKSVCVKMGFINIIHATEIFEFHLAHAPEWFVDIGPDYFKDNKLNILNAFDLMADIESHDVFTSFLEIYIKKKIRTIQSHPLEEQYLPKDIFKREAYSRTVNCGSYDGDTIKSIYCEYGRFDALACFEPDLINYKKLSEYLKIYSIADTTISFPCGVFSSTKMLRFKSDQNTNSSIALDGNAFVQVVSLDDVLPDFRPTFINMDIEGAEPEALLGATRLINSFAPYLAISIYHSQFVGNN